MAATLEVVHCELTFVEAVREARDGVLFLMMLTGARLLATLLLLHVGDGVKGDLGTDVEGV